MIRQGDQEGQTMSAVTYTRDLQGYLEDVSGGRAHVSSRVRHPSLFARFVVALHRSRQLQAAREIERHRDLIARYSKMAE
jgi:hypothetical protein